MKDKVTWKNLYNPGEIYQSALKLYTKTLFNRKKGLATSHDDQTLFDYATHTNSNLDRLITSLNKQQFSFSESESHHFSFNGKERTR